ncbi:MAG: hypothetical protein LBE32_03350 [Burkholderiales bacterium]|nr:hypothetical protein [Burkholderiales bacterium]
MNSDITPDKLEQRLLDLRDSANDNAQADDLLTEILLKIGFSLSARITPLTIAGLAVKRVDSATADADASSAQNDMPLLLAYLDEHTKPTL